MTRDEIIETTKENIKNILLLHNSYEAREILLSIYSKMIQMIHELDIEEENAKKQNREPVS